MEWNGHDQFHPVGGPVHALAPHLRRRVRPRLLRVSCSSTRRTAAAALRLGRARTAGGPGPRRRVRVLPRRALCAAASHAHVVLYTSSGGGSKVEKVVVQGAGGPNFNTIYYPVGNADGVPMYGGEKGGGTSTLRREGGMWVAKGHAGVTRYQCKSDAAQPPETGWESLGWGSAPTLQIQKTYDEEESPRGNNTASVIFFILHRSSSLSSVITALLPWSSCSSCPSFSA